MANTLDRIEAQAESMQKSVDKFSRYFDSYDKRLAKWIENELKQYKQSNGRLQSDYDYTDSLRRLDQFVMYALINENVVSFINSGIKDFDKLRVANVNLHNELNGAGLTRNFHDYTLNAQSSVILDNFTQESAIRTWFVNPFKAALVTAVETGASVDTVKRFLKAWETQGVQSGIISGVNSIPNFSQYSGQLARDAVFKTNNAMNNSVRETLGLTSFRYVGGLMKDTRPFCRHLVQLNRVIEFSEVPKLGATYPQGLIKPFTIDTFCINAGGYNCLHQVFPTRLKI